jgi:enamine deaminase RidA (YjgF/YER057c/UK114 family)
VALTAIRYGAQNSVAIEGTADIKGLEAAGGSIENDPLSAAVGVSELARPGTLVEIEAIAVL